MDWLSAMHSSLTTNADSLQAMGTKKGHGIPPNNTLTGYLRKTKR